jgi:hypothetical protein
MPMPNIASSIVYALNRDSMINAEASPTTLFTVKELAIFKWTIRDIMERT